MAADQIDRDFRPFVLRRRSTARLATGATLALLATAVTGGAAHAVDITGTDGPDVIIGTPQRDVLRGWPATTGSRAAPATTGSLVEPAGTR